MSDGRKGSRTERNEGVKERTDEREQTEGWDKREGREKGAQKGRMKTETEVRNGRRDKRETEPKGMRG